jgi:hypothetical protein
MTVVRTVTLTEFLLARIAEDELAARIANVSQTWSTDETACCVMVEHDYGDNVETHHNGTAAHIARHDPARVLAECEAKRRIVADAAEYLDHVGGIESTDGLAMRVLEYLALPYADHPDWRGEWKR